MIGTALFLSVKLPMNIELLLQILGGLIGITLTILYPIFIFNKAYKNSGQYGYILYFNWLLFATAIAVGSAGVYEGVRQFKNTEILLVIN